MTEADNKRKLYARDQAGTHVLVLGLGETGRSVLRWLRAIGHVFVRAADSRDVPPMLDELKAQHPDVEFHCGVFRNDLLDDSLKNNIDLIVASPGISLREPLLIEAARRGIPVIGDIELFAWHLEEERLHLAHGEKEPLLIAITGANGKTTVTSMVGTMCRAAGLDTVVAGNIAPAVLDAVMDRNGKKTDAWVLELSSFQLETTFSLEPDAATVLNISEDHLDRYDDMDDYVAAKVRIFRSRGSHACAQVLNRDDAVSHDMAQSGRVIVTFGLTLPPAENDWGILRDGTDITLMQGSQRVLNANELRVPGLHNIANALAALALCRAVNLPLEPLLNALREFESLPHRVERVAEINGVTWYDDSKGTNVGATVAALTSFGQRNILIAGGDGKGQDFAPLAPAVAKHARAVVLIGRDADMIADALKETRVPLKRASDMEDAVKQAAQFAHPGDIVLLSPACASFDMFRNYAHRAEVFVNAVRSLH
ncbi:MAG: UDP-N-acetylmuramoyl-L-alanine--D-glutamate ligase [Methylobacillus sp.]|jgi:UDP-N-acetylmuramoylalanine--D-glutamate ligase|nr:UDP-N-acetylmuramoyl-L-alanine--D-glutamate ligase [Methylobacillus sp.]